jgi:hypothetical protein
MTFAAQGILFWAKWFLSTLCASPFSLFVHAALETASGSVGNPPTV